MGKIFLALVCAAGAAGGYWYFANNKGAQLTEAEVRKYYSQDNAWLDARDSKSLCDSLDPGYRGHAVNVQGAQRQVVDTDKPRACQDYVRLFETLKALEAAGAGQISTEITQEVDSVSVSADKKTATVAVRSAFKVGMPGQPLFRISAKGSDTLVKRQGRVYRSGSDATVVME